MTQPTPTSPDATQAYATGSEPHPALEAPTMSPAPTPRPAGQNRLLLAVAGAVTLLAVIGGTAAITAAVVGGGGATPAAASTTKAPSAWELEQATAKDRPATTAPAVPAAGPTLVASDITLTAKITDKQCFGSAGCNVTVKIEMAYAGPALSPADTFDVTYEITGIEDGPAIGTFEVTGDQYTQSEKLVQTATPGATITVKVTDVDKQGL